MTKTYKLEGKIKITTEGGDFSVEVPADEIRRLIPKLLKEKTHKPWRAESVGEYWFVDDEGDVDSDEEWGHSGDNHRYLTGNYFQTKEEAIAYVDRLEAIGRVTHAIIAANEGWEPDWSDEDERKYYLYYSHSWNEFDCGAMERHQEAQTLPFAKSSEIAERIIKEHEDDLRIIFKLD